MSKSSLPEWLIIWIWKALLGEIYPEIRAIAIGFTKKRELTIRYYLDRDPTETDYENISCVVSEILSNTSSNNEISSVTEEVVFSLEPISGLKIFDGLIYARREFQEEM